MKVIDLLNKIANGEEIPKRIKYKDDIYMHVDNYCYYCDETNLILSDRIFAEYNRLNDEVEIIEDMKIEKIDQNDREWHYLHNTKKTTEEVADNLEHLRQKINEIIDYLEEKE